jgi:type VI secretion system protein VasD
MLKKLMCHRVLKLMMITTVSLSLAACGSFFSNNVHHVSVEMRSARYLNPNIQGRPSPLVVTFYQLKSPFAFKQASYAALSKNAGAVLGQQLIDQQLSEVRPNSLKKTRLLLSPNIAYIGIVAAYRNLNQAHWRAVVKVNPKINSLLKVSLESQAMSSTIQKAGFLL